MPIVTIQKAIMQIKSVIIDNRAFTVWLDGDLVGYKISQEIRRNIY